jgi:hypothetical protein
VPGLAYCNGNYAPLTNVSRYVTIQSVKKTLGSCVSRPMVSASGQSNRSQEKVL